MSPVSDEDGNGDLEPIPEYEAGNENEIWERVEDQSEVTSSDNASQGTDPELPWETNIRLPRSVIPIHYDLYLFPELDTGLFSGNEPRVIHALLMLKTFERGQNAYIHTHIYIYIYKAFGKYNFE